MAGDRKIRVVVDEQTGTIQYFSDGDAMTEEEGIALTKQFFALAGGTIPGGIEQTGEIEFHKNSDVSHVHIVGHHTHKH